MESKHLDIKDSWLFYFFVSLKVGEMFVVWIMYEWASNEGLTNHSLNLVFSLSQGSLADHRRTITCNIVHFSTLVPVQFSLLTSSILAPVRWWQSWHSPAQIHQCSSQQIPACLHSCLQHSFSYFLQGIPENVKTKKGCP